MVTMMLLLDSQVVLWLLDDNPRLGPKARQSIRDAGHIYASVATIWELTIKMMLGKLKVPTSLGDKLVEQGLTILDVTAEHAEGIAAFPELARHDPFDRLLISQAATTGMTLLTADNILLELGRGFVVNATR